MKVFVFAFSLLMTLASLLGCGHSPAEVTDAEYRVLSAYTAGKFVGREGVRQIVIFNETLKGAEAPRGIVDLNNNIPGLNTVHSQVYRAFLDANLHPSSFHRSFTLPIPYQIVASSEIHSIFGTPGDIWGRYYEKYPNSTGLLRLSRVGFNSDGNQAALYASTYCGGLCGSGYFVIMEKIDSNWKVVQEVEVWVS
jgi:hypothetical protein